MKSLCLGCFGSIKNHFTFFRTALSLSSCSEYAKALHSPFLGHAVLSLWRILRCHPECRWLRPCTEVKAIHYEVK